MASASVQRADDGRSDRQGADAVDAAPTRTAANLPRAVVRWYLALGAVWIVGTDLALHSLEGGRATVAVADIAKGLVFIAVSSMGLWAVLRRLSQSHDQRLVAALRAERDRFETILRTTSDPIAIFGMDGRIRYVNRATTETLGWHADEVIGATGREYIDVRDRAAAFGYLENVAASGEPSHVPRTFRLRHRDGGSRTMEVTAAPLRIGGHLEGVVFTARDISERARRDEQLRTLLAGDATGLPTLSTFTAEMGWLDALIGREGTSLLVVVADIERFGTVNDLYGRAAGDIVLRETAQRFEASLPEAVGWWRHGADAFLAVVIETDDADPIDRRGMVDRVRAEAVAPIRVTDDERIRIDIAIAVAEVPLDSGPHSLAPTLLRAGEEALHEARRHPDRFLIADAQGAGTAAADRARIVAQLYDGIERGELVAYYQPKVDLAREAVIGAEALVRWEHPTRGLLAPGAFLWAVEFANLIPEITRIVLRDALHQVVRWRAEGLEHEVSVNISLDDLRRERFASEVLEALDEAGAEPDWLCLELTEHAVLADVSRANATVAQLRQAGVRMAIDDFGTGFSSFEHLRVFDIDELKIDRSFVTGLVPGSANDVIVSSVIPLGRGLGAKVTAEGIEDLHALNHLLDLGCDQGQGYLFGRPVPAGDFPHTVDGVVET